MTMTNAQKNWKFLSTSGSVTVEEILGAIAAHYVIDKADALAEVTQDEAEHLLEYLTGNIRAVTCLMMQRQGLGF